MIGRPMYNALAALEEGGSCRRRSHSDDVDDV